MSVLTDYNNGESHCRNEFDDDDQDGHRASQWQIPKFGTDARWLCQILPMPEFNLPATDCRRIIQGWRGGVIFNEILNPPLPDINNLNSKIPESEWERDMCGNPRPPYQLNHVIYL